VVGGACWARLVFECHWGVVVPGKIYRSSEMPGLMVRNKLVANNIKVILLLTQDPADADTEAERSAAADLGVKILQYPLEGNGVGDPGNYVEAISSVSRANAEGQAVLIRCHSGAQRTGGVVAVYRVLVEGDSPDESKQELERWGWDGKKNPKLLPFLNQHMAEWAAELKERGVIDRTPDPIPQFSY
jgi:protein-tyrosine phosphatase